MWQPIETAPKDGTKIWVHNGKDYGVGLWHQNPPELDWKYDVSSPPGELKRIPNPNAGRISGLWWIEWASDNIDYDGNYEGPHVPTHWMPLPEPPCDP